MSLNQPSSEPPTNGPAGESKPVKYPRSSFNAWLERRREKAVAEIERNRRGEYVVPTWVLVVALVAIVIGWAAVIIFV
jgi:hypothetical protein